MDSGTIAAIVGSSGFVAVVTHLLTRKSERAKILKTQAEIDNIHIDGVDKTVKIYEGLLEKLTKRISDLEKETEILKDENKKLNLQLLRFNDQILKLHEENTNLHSEIEKLMKILNGKNK